jgi:extradiol dioxygenase family protein
MKVNTIISLVSKITMLRLIAPAFAAGKNVRSTSIATKLFSTTTATLKSSTSTTEYETKAQPAPGDPFHYAFPVHSLEAAKEFYGTVLGCKEGRSSDKWQDYSLYGHQIVCHWAGSDYRCIDYYNPVDGDEVPVPHAGVALETVEQFNSLVARLRAHNIKFVIEPHLRFKGEPGEQYTMFFKDPSGNNLEFKAMTNHEKLFAKYNVPSE